jgi:hypothetical protein
MENAIGVPVRMELVKEIVMRSQGRVDPAGLIENVLVDFLDKTRGDPDIWSKEHAEEVAEETTSGSLSEYGLPSKGYSWQSLFLPNGTQLKMPYQGKDHFAEIRHQQLYYQSVPCSPSQFASRVARNTSRNAWRDIWVKRPGDDEWRLALTLR